MTSNVLPTLLAALHKDIETSLVSAREALTHATEKGDASEAIWIELLRKYLPARYAVDKAHVVDCNGLKSQQIDVVIYDRQYTPLIFRLQDAIYIPAESVYAVFEAKQEITAEVIRYARNKIGSVRALYRTSLPVPTVEGEKPAKSPGHILGGVLALASGWSPPLGDTLVSHLQEPDQVQLDIGCIASSGTFQFDGETLICFETDKAVTMFLLEIIAMLQSLGTVPMIDVRAYSRHLVS